MKRAIFILSILTLFIPTFVSALITYPYTVDEKLQVIFADSWIGSNEYYGLQNYTQDYVDGYAHLTFTYSHNKCCFSSKPPSLYITDVDPRTTSMPTERSLSDAFRIASKNSDSSIETGWYFYDIQFDMTGYNVSVKLQATSTEIHNEHRNIAGQTDNDWVALVNQQPYLSTGLPYFSTMAFTPVPIKETEIEPTINPVIIIPGIMGSARKNGELVIDPILHTYDDLLATLDANGYTLDIDLFTFPYEWRDSNVFSANHLNDKIEEIKSVCEANKSSSEFSPNLDCDKVDLVAHSMGGLVARSYIQSGDYDSDVDQLIFLGTPHKGAPTAYLQWEAGEGDVDFWSRLQTGFLWGEALRNGYLTIFNYIQNTPILSVQELLPIFDYLKDDDTGIVRNYPNNYSRNFFLEILDNNTNNLLSSGVEITNIVADSGEDKTIETIRVAPTTHATFWEHGEPDGFGALLGDDGLERGVGDNAVTEFGATLDNSITNQNSNASHRRIPTVEANKIYNILTGKNSTTNIDSGLNLDSKVLLLQLLSPVDFVITDPQGRKMGKNFEAGEEYNEIPLAFYSGYQTDDEYVTILNPLDGEYKVELQGMGSGGEYTVLTSYISDEVITTTEVVGITTPNQITNLDVEVDNQNPENLESEREITLDVMIADINGACELGWIKDEKTKNSLIKQVKLIIKFEQKGGGKHEAKVDKILIKLLQKELDLLLKKDKINQQAYDLLKTDLEYLINNN